MLRLNQELEPRVLIGRLSEKLRQKNDKDPENRKKGRNIRNVFNKGQQNLPSTWDINVHTKFRVGMPLNLITLVNIWHLIFLPSGSSGSAWPLESSSYLPKHITVVFSSVQFSHSVVSDSLRPHEPQQTWPPCPSPTPGVHPNPCPSSWWCHPTISSSVVPFSSCPQSFPASGSLQMSQLFTSGGQSIGVQLQHQSFQWTPRTDFL